MSSHLVMSSPQITRYHPVMDVIPHAIILYNAYYMKRTLEVITDNIAQYGTVTSYWTGKVGLSNPIGIIRLGHGAIYPDGNTCGVQQAFEDLQSARAMQRFGSCNKNFRNSKIYLVQGHFQKLPHLR